MQGVAFRLCEGVNAAHREGGTGGGERRSSDGARERTARQHGRLEGRGQREEDGKHEKYFSEKPGSGD